MKPPRHQIDLTKIEPLHSILSLKQQEQRKNIEGCKREKTMYKGKPTKIAADCSTETLKARRAWSEVYWALSENNFSPMILYSANYYSKLTEE
jgi:Zn-dependent M32 family carboxypeptidase